MEIRKVLVVDNNHTVVELLGGLLEKKGIEVLKAYDGIDALDRLEESAPLPDVILLDLVMPKIDGQRLTRILKADRRYCDIPIVILSGIAAEDKDYLLSSGADAYIAKGKIDDTFSHIEDTLKWLKERATPAEKKNEVLGTENMFPREMTKELLLVKQHFDSMFNLMQEGVIEIDQDNRILFANPAAMRLIDQEDHQLFGESILKLFQEQCDFGEYLAKVPEPSWKSNEYTQLTCGKYITRAIATPFFIEGEYIGAIVILEDITSIILREKSLQDLMEAIVRNAPVGLCLLDAEGKVLISNKALAKTFRQPAGWSPEGVAMQAFLSPMSPPLSELVGTSLTIPTGESITLNADFFPAGEKSRQVLSMSTTALDTTGREKVLLLVEDVTDKALLEENLRRVNEEMEKANRSKSNFLSMVSHELRTPLAVVRGYVSLILEGKIGPEPGQVREALLVADKRARHLQHLIEELLDLSRIESGNLSIRQESIFAAKHILETVDMFRDEMEKKGLSVELSLAEDLPHVWADHDKIHQIFTNLVSNAVKFSNSGGSLFVGAALKGEWVEFQVRDSGIGIPPDRLDRIFDKFYQVDSSDTRKHAGTGLGLSIVKMIITAMEGEIHVTSEVGKGTTFTFTLPVTTEVPVRKAVPKQEEEEAGEEEPSAVRRRILIVEDDADILEMTRLFLAEKNFDVVTAADAFDGLKEFFRHPPDLILADALLPLMTGLDLCRIVKTHPGSESLPVIILSAAAQEDEIRSGYDVGASEYLVKPFTSQDLFDTIAKHLP
jgi:PAS domain S-box-containing protein